MAKRGTIRFRCSWCNKRHAVGGDQVGVRLACTCGERMRVPRWSGMSSRDKRLSDWCIETLVYGGGGAVVGFLAGIAVIITARKPGYWNAPGWELASIVGAATLIGFSAGLFRERLVHW